MAETAQGEPYRMSCMEVWGGNEPTDRGVVMPGLNVWVRSRPLGGAGGDVHYVSSCATGRITRLLVADVSGHGVEVAEVAGHLRTLMRANVNYMEQSRFLRALNEEFSELNEIGRFATAVVATYWAPTRYVTLSNAGHPRPWWYVGKNRRWRAVETVRGREAMSNLPLGIAPPATYDQVTLTLTPGDMLLFYTDAVIEALNPRTGQRLGEAGLGDLLAEVEVSDPATVLEQVISRLEAFTAGDAIGDDLTLMLLTPNDIGAARTMGDWIHIVRRFLGLVRTSGRDQPVPWPQMNVVSIGGAFLGRLNRWYGKGPRDGQSSSAR